MRKRMKHLSLYHFLFLQCLWQVATSRCPWSKLKLVYDDDKPSSSIESMNKTCTQKRTFAHPECGFTWREWTELRGFFKGRVIQFKGDSTVYNMFMYMIQSYKAGPLWRNVISDLKEKDPNFKWYRWHHGFQIPDGPRVMFRDGYSPDADMMIFNTEGLHKLMEGHGGEPLIQDKHRGLVGRYLDTFCAMQNKTIFWTLSNSLVDWYFHLNFDSFNPGHKPVERPHFYDCTVRQFNAVEMEMLKNASCPNIIPIDPYTLFWDRPGCTFFGDGRHYPTPTTQHELSNLFINAFQSRGEEQSHEVLPGDYQLQAANLSKRSIPGPEEWFKKWDSRGRPCCSDLARKLNMCSEECPTACGA